MRRFIVACFIAMAPLAATAEDLIPLNDLGPAPYRLGYFGGLYGNGSSLIPADHLAAGLAIAQGIRPLDSNGNPSPSGKIGFMVVGMGDTGRVACAFYRAVPCEAGSLTSLVRNSQRVNPALVVLNAAHEDYDMVIASGYGEPIFNRMRDSLLAQAGVTEKQVQVAWLQISTNHPNTSIIRPAGDAYYVKGAIGNILRALKARYPNLQIAYLSSRPYGGYSANNWNTEPFAYETALSVRWVVMEQISSVTDTRVGPVSYVRGDVPWIAWGPYMWANGMTPRSDGLSWQLEDFEPAGEYLSERGARKSAMMLFDFLMTEPTARSWFLRPGAPARFRAVRK